MTTYPNPAALGDAWIDRAQLVLTAAEPLDGAIQKGDTSPALVAAEAALRGAAAALQTGLLVLKHLEDGKVEQNELLRALDMAYGASLHGISALDRARKDLVSEERLSLVQDAFTKEMDHIRQELASVAGRS